MQTEPVDTIPAGRLGHVYAVQAHTRLDGSVRWHVLSPLQTTGRSNTPRRLKVAAYDTRDVAIRDAARRNVEIGHYGPPPERAPSRSPEVSPSARAGRALPPGEEVLHAVSGDTLARIDAEVASLGRSQGAARREHEDLADRLAHLTNLVAVTRDEVTQLAATVRRIADDLGVIV